MKMLIQKGVGLITSLILLSGLARADDCLDGSGCFIRYESARSG